MFLTKKVYLRRCVMDRLRVVEDFISKVGEIGHDSLPAGELPKIEQLMNSVLRSLTLCPDRLYWEGGHVASDSEGTLITVKGEIKIESRNEAYGEWSIEWNGLRLVYQTDRIILSNSSTEYAGP